MNQKLLKQCVAEFIGTFALIFIGVGAIYNCPGNLLAIALAHGLTIAVMVSATGGISGGHLNPAVTFGLLVGGKIDLKNSMAYWIAQLAGGTAAAYLIIGLAGNAGLAAVDAGTPDIAVVNGVARVTLLQAAVIEMVLTFFLVFVVYGSAVDARAPKIGGLAIGLTVAIDILFGGPFTGASMNPARTFGPAFACGHWNHQIIYWVGPMLGGALAGLVYGRFLIREN